MSLQVEAGPKGTRVIEMNKRFFRLTKAITGLSVMLMLAVALVAAQARANVHDQASTTASFELTDTVSVIVYAERLRKLEVLPRGFDTALALPVEIDLNNRETRLHGIDHSIDYVASPTE